jgi:membrane protease YdiL (CAAX protease family)
LYPLALRGIADGRIPCSFPWKFFIMSFGISWLLWLPGWLATQGLIVLPLPFAVFFFAGTWGPFAAASWFTWRSEGRAGLRAFWKCGFDFHFSKWWLLVILGVALLAAVLPLGVYLLTRGAPPDLALLSRPWMIVPIFLTYFFTGGGNEEWGWRGYALDRPQDRWPPLKASLILGAIWGLWHLPLFFIAYAGQYHMPLLLFLLFAPAMSILHSWVYNGTGGKLLAAWLLHAAFGTAWEFFPIVQPQLVGYGRVFVYDLIATGALALAVVWLTRARLGMAADPDHR